MENDSIAFYKSRIEELSVDLHKFKKRSKIWVGIRLLFFLMMLAHAIFSFPYNLFSGITLVVMIVVFFYLVRKSIENKEELNFVKRVLQINENEIKASQHDFSNFDGGEEFKDSHHPFSFDMDLFGKRSFFQFFNRTVTKKGKKSLVSHFLEGIKFPKRSAAAVDELTKHMKWCQEYLAFGDSLEKKDTEKGITAVLKEELIVKSWMKWLRFILPVIAIFICFAYYFAWISGLLFVVGVVVVLFPIRQTLKTTNRIQKTLTNLEGRVQGINNQLSILEKVDFSSVLLKEYQDVLFHKEGNAKEGIKQFAKLVKEFSYRNNILVAILLNFFLAWDHRLLVHLQEWKKNNENQLADWENILYELEALISGAIYRFNLKEHTTTPILKEDKNSKIILQNLGHPIIPLSKLVKNSFSFSSEQQFAIITGPNMAGKSTFLRSVGINLMLAKAGFHVFAEKFEFPDLKLYSSMRTTDDLKEETSYFHAELLRLRFIVDAIERGEDVFIILDEILKGTNSKDKKEGSAQFLRKLNQLGVRGIIATHDLSLTELAKENKSIINRYFDTEIEGEEISFDYSIREGVAQNMNASFLLKKMGLVEK